MNVASSILPLSVAPFKDYQSFDPILLPIILHCSGGPKGGTSPLFQNIIIEIYPKMLENISRRAFPRICESLKGVV